MRQQPLPGTKAPHVSRALSEGVRAWVLVARQENGAALLRFYHINTVEMLKIEAKPRGRPARARPPSKDGGVKKKKTPRVNYFSPPPDSPKLISSQLTCWKDGWMDGCVSPGFSDIPRYNFTRSRPESAIFSSDRVCLEVSLRSGAAAPGLMRPGSRSGLSWKVAGSRRSHVLPHQTGIKPLLSAAETGSSANIDAKR